MKINHLHLPEKVIREENTYTNTFGRFIMQPLEKGYGVTIGNALRRILISSLPGTAIVAMQVNDIQHEFTTIKGVVEDVSEIILNLKEVRFKDLTGKASKIELSISGPAELKAKHIQEATADLEILNPDLHIATLNKEGKMNIELRIGSGIGYVPSEENKKHELPLGFIAIDSLFSPILNVNFVIENTRVAQKTDYEKLILEITTDGSIHPKDALKEAAKILIYHFMLFSEDKITIDYEDKMANEEFDEEILHMRQLLKTKLVDLDLSVRALNCLKAAEVESLGDLVKFNKNDLLKFRNFGKKSLTELDELLETMSLSFGMDVAKYKLDKD